MAYISPKDRFQIYFTSLEEGIFKDNPVRFIDAFVDAGTLINFVNMKKINSRGMKQATKHREIYSQKPTY